MKKIATLFTGLYALRALLVFVIFLGMESVGWGQIAQRGTATTGTTNGTSMTINKPSGVIAGDVMIMVIAKTQYTSNPTSTGWTLIAGARQGSGNRHAAVLYKVVDGTEGTSFTVSLGNGNTSGAGTIFAFSGVSPSVFDVTPGSLSTGAGYTATASSITTSTNDAAVIFIGGTGNGSWSNWSGTNPAFTEIADYNNGRLAVGAAWGTRSSAGSTGNRTVSTGGNLYYGVMMIALRPAPLSSPYTITTPGTSTFTVPAGVTSLTVEAWGGGGRGGDRTDNNNVALAGGGGGAYSKGTISVTPGNSYTVVVGAGSTSTAAGGDSYFINTATLLAKGGGSVADNSNTAGSGGAAASGVGTTKYSGGNGATGTGGSFGGGGGSSAGTAFNGNFTNTTTNQRNGATAPSGGGDGGTGAASGTPGTIGSTPGGGGGGGYRAGSMSTQEPGDGADGQVIITWSTCTVTPYNVTGGGSYCSGGSGVEVGLDDSETGVNYQLYCNSVAIGSLISGNGNAISFGNQTTAGTYTVVGTNGDCSNSMNGSVEVIVSATPTVTGVTICQGGYGTLTSMSCGLEETISTEATFAGTGDNITGVGNYSWSNTGGITANDNNSASVDVGAGRYRLTNYLGATNFGFSIPAGATINGIEVSIGRYSDGGPGDRNMDNIVRLVKGGTITGDNKANDGVNWPTAEEVATYGSSTDLWDETWSPSDINASNFGVVLSVENTNSRSYRMAYVDYIQITVTYTLLPELTDWYTVPTGGVIVQSGSPFNPIGDAQVIDQGGIYANLANSNTPGTYSFYAECTNMPGCRARADFVINPKATTTIIPDPAVVCINQPLYLNVNVSGGSGAIITHNWWGTGGVFLSDTDIPDPVFNSDYAGTLNLNYEFTDINGCTGSDDIEIIVNQNNTVTDASSSPIPCIGTDMTEITHTTTGATGISNDNVPGANGLPPGVSAHWASNTITISGTPTASGPFSYSIPLTGGCGTVYATGTINVKPDNTVSGPSPATTTLCINTALTPITHITTGATGIGTATNLPAGVTASWSSNTITINGTPTSSGTFDYSIQLAGGCGNVNATGRIIVTPNNTAGAASSTPSICINTPLTNITHTTTGATGISNDNISGANGLPAGVSAHWTANTITISGTPSTAGTFNYSIPLTGGCGNINATGTITVNPVNTVTAASLSPTVCVGTVMTSIIHTTTGATGIGTPINLPAGVTAEWKLDRITINGTPSATGTFNYTIPLIGGCGSVNATGTITVSPNMSVTGPSTILPVCVNSALTPITHTTTGATGIGTPTGLPAGISAAWAANTITISGTPTVSGTFSYSIPVTGGCGPTVFATGTITVNANMSSTPPSSTPSLCINTALSPLITITTGGATGISNDNITGANGLPAGVKAQWAANTITISGTPTVSGTFNYSIPLEGGCGSASATGSIIVRPDNTVTIPSAPTTVCINTSLPVISLTTTGATGIGTPTGLPAGVTAVWAANTITITGTPTVSGAFDYSIPLTGGCGAVNATGTINVTEASTANAGTAMADICQGQTSAALGGSVGGSATGGSWSSSAGGTFNPSASDLNATWTPPAGYSGTATLVLTTTGPCASASASKTIIVNPLKPVSLTISADTNPVCAGSSVTFTATPVNGGANPTYQWRVNSINTGTNSPSFTFTPTNGDVVTCVLTSNATCASGSPATSPPGTMIVNPLLPASVSIATSANPVCDGTSVTFTATPTNGGTNPTYQWYKNSTAVATGSTYSYTPANGDQVYVVMTADPTLTCGTGSPATSTTVTMVVNSTLPASVSIAASANPVCNGSSVTFTATPTNGGSTPTYQWYKNSTAVATGSTYSYTPANGDQVYVVMTADPTLTCGTGSPATSSTVTMVVNPLLPVSVSIAASANPVCDGTSVTFTATPTNGGTNPTYQWYKNTVAVGTGTTYSYTPANGDQVYVVMTADPTLNCGTGSPATSNTIPMVVNPLLPVSVSIAASANSVCDGTSVTFTATPTNGGTTPTYQWYKNSTAMGTEPTYTYTPAHGDQVYVVMTADPTLTCGTGSPATSDTVSMVVNPLLPASVSIEASANPVCDGTSVTFTATPTNGGTNPVYQWRVNSTPTGSNLPIFSYNPANGDVVTCVLTSNANCISGNPSTSNQVIMTVNTLPTATIEGTAFVCLNDPQPLVTFTGSGGTTPYTFTYRVNSGAFLTVTTEVSQSTVTLPVPTATPGSYIYELVSVSDQYSCSNPVSNSVTVTINPKPFMNPVSNQVKCDGEYSNAISFSGTNVITYHWTNNNPSIGIPASGTGDISSSLLDNTGDTPVVATFTVTPRYSAGGVDCDGSPITFTITVNPSVTPPTDITVSAGVEPVCQLTNSTTTTTYATNASNYTDLTWSVSPGGAGVINSSGMITWTNGFAGNVDISVVATGCNGSSPPVTRTIYITPTVSTPSPITITAGTEPTCQLTNGTTTTTYSTEANNNTGFNWSVIPAEAGTINSSGVMTWTNGFSGIATIMVTASGCNGPSAPVTRVVTVYTLPTVAISYPASTYCSSENTPIPVTISGTGAFTGGSYSSLPAGLTRNSIGTITPSGSAPGIYTVTYTLPTAGCGTITANTTVTITALPTVTFNYAGNPFCNSVTTEQPVTVTGTGAYSGGTYSSTPAGLSLNPTTGGITPSTSTPGTYTVSYSTLAAGGCGVVTATRSVTVTTMPVATFSYPSNTYCTNAPNPSPVFSGGVAGTFTASPSGLEFVSPTTGQIDMINSKTGNYTVTNTVAASGGCPQVSATFNVVIVVQPTAAISYSGSPFCTSLTASQPVTLTGTGVFTGGTFSSSPAGLSIDSSTGAITPSASTAGTYTVTYNLAVAGGCNPVTATTQVTITLAPVATFSYPGSPFCSDAGKVLPTFSGGGTAGTFSASPGLVLDKATGEIDVSASITGTYTIINTIAAANGCDAVTASTSVTIHVRPAVTVDYCSAESPKIRIQASGGTSYSWVTPPYQGVTADHIDVDLVGVYGVTVTNESCVQTVYSTVNEELAKYGDFENVPNGYVFGGYRFRDPDITPWPYDPINYPGDPYSGNYIMYDTNVGNYVSGDYTIWDDANDANPYMHGAHDHTTGSGKYMIIDGTSGDVVVWEQIITVEPNKTYYFSAWGINLYYQSGYPVPKLSFEINDSIVGTSVELNSGVLADDNPWVFRFYGNWNSGDATTARVRIVNLVPGLDHNDFGLDDISFGSLEPPPSTLISALGTDNQSICVDTRLTDIIYSTYKASTATVTGLPAGVEASGIVSNNLTISGIPTEFGVFNYEITFSGCGPDFTKTGKITVRPPVTAGIISGTSPLCIATTATYSSDGNTGGTWSSSNPSVATVNENTGLVTALSQGTTNITYTVNSGCGAPVYSFKTLTVMPNASITSVTGTNESLCIGSTITYAANGVVLSGGTGTWSSSNTSVATVDAYGVITGVGPGTCDITYTISGGCNGIVSASKPVTVVTAGTITGTTPLCIGDITTFSSSGTPGGTWSSSNQAVAVVNATTGEVTAVSAGTVDISYTLSSSCGPVTATKTVTVNPDGNPGNITGDNQVCIGVGTTFTISGTPGGTWSSTDTDIATVDPATGVVTGVDAGSCNIVYTLPSGIFCGANLTAMMPITVYPDANITSVTGPKDQLCTGESTHLSANDVVLGGGTGAWSSSDISIVTVDATGLVTAIGEGTATVSYTITGGCGGTKSKDKQIIVNICPLHYRTVNDGLWNNHSIWETSENLGGPWTSATTSPTAYNSLSITVRNTHTVEVTTNVPVARTTIEPGGEVTINAGATVNNVGTNGAADFVINSESATTGNGYGSLQVNGFYSGLITYNLWVTNSSGCPGYTDRAYIISSPVSGQEAQALRSAGSITGIKEYNEGINDWGGDISGNLAPGKGYAIYKAGSPGLVPFIGTPNTGDIQVPVSSSYSRYGWNSVGNPYTSALQIKENTGFIYHNIFTNEVLEPGYGAIYMWNEGICNFDVINFIDYRPDWSEYYWGKVNYSTDAVVQVGQGFLVNIKWPHPGLDIEFTPGMQLHSTKTTLKKASTSWPGITLVAQNGTTTERTIITFFEGGTTGMDPGYDAGTLPAYPFQLYTRMVTGNEDFNLAIQTLPVDQYEQLVIPIGVESPSGGEVIFKAGGIILPEGLYPIFEDRLLNTNTPLKTFNDSYKVTVPPGTRGTGRFYIRFSHVTPVNGVLQPAFMLAAWFADNRIIISGNTGRNTRAMLYDLNGRKLGEYLLTDENRNEIPALGVVTGIYLLHIRGDRGTQVIKVPVVMDK